MTMKDLKNLIPACPICGNGCPIDEPACPRGRELSDRLLAGEITPEDALREYGEDEDAENDRPRHEGRRCHKGCPEGRPCHKRHSEDGTCHEARPEGRRPHFMGCRMGGGYRKVTWFGPQMGPVPQRGFGPGMNFGPQKGFGPGMDFGPHGRKPHDRVLPEDAPLKDLIRLTVHAARPQAGPGIAQKRILELLKDQENLSQRDLLHRLGIRPGSLSELLWKLEGRGWIARVQDESDKRRNLIRLTDEGRAAAEKNAALDDPFSVLTDEEQETLRALLKKVLDQGE